MSQFAPDIASDPLSAFLAFVLLAMSVASWTVIVYKTWFLRRVETDITQGKAVFWQASDVAQAVQALQSVDRNAVLMPLAQAHHHLMPNTLGAQGDVHAQRTRVLRDALHSVLQRLHWGQVLLATVGSTAPFVGLLGTVWGIYHALTGIATAGQLSIEQVAGPVGESLIMTAAGLGVALPAVLAFNVMGRMINRLEHELEGFAHDLRAL
ncbi:MAG: MotA/TolQ/ExbB proton channel family protein [Burkholderiales bacterium]|nr:MotA/TolQ/ExbB proton channel family protein [Burkholderiales bacterium]